MPRKRQKIVDGVCNRDGREQQKISYSHSTMCQTALPFKDMGSERKWVSKNGLSIIMLEAGSVLHPEKDEYIELGVDPSDVWPQSFNTEDVRLAFSYSSNLMIRICHYNCVCCLFATLFLIFVF